MDKAVKLWPFHIIQIRTLSQTIDGEHQMKDIPQDPAGCCQIVVANTPKKRHSFTTKTHATNYN